MRGGFVACLGGEPHLVERAAERLRWHRGAPATHRAGRLTIACLSDPQQGPFVETRGGAARLVHGASPAPLAELRRTATRYAALEWDGTTLKAGRDALGLAPLFYRRLPNALWLATEVGPLAALETPRADLEALSAQAGFVPFAGRTGWCDIYRVGPGEELAVAARDCAWRQAADGTPPMYSDAFAAAMARPWRSSAIALRVQRPTASNPEPASC
jgi:hypothetical protein